MAFSNLLSIQTEKWKSRDAWKIYLKDIRLECEKLWLDPWNKKNAVILREREIYHRPQSCIQPEDTTPSIIVECDFANTCFGFEDKLRLLFQCKKWGGSEVIETQKYTDSIYEVTFKKGWDSVLSVCGQHWKIDGKTLQVTPFFQLFRKRKDSHEPNIFPKPASTKDTHSETKNTYSSGDDSFVVIEPDTRSRKKYVPGIGTMSPYAQEYIKRFYPHNDIATQHHDWNKVQSILEQMMCKPYELSFPHVIDFLNNEGKDIKEDIENKFKCLIKESSSPKMLNYSNAMLLTSSIGQLKIHLVQGDARNVISDASLHIDTLENKSNSGHDEKKKRKVYTKPDEVNDDKFYNQLKQEFEKLSSLKVETLVVSSSTKLTKYLCLDDFAGKMIEQIRSVFGGRDQMDIILCVADSHALLKAYKYTLIPLSHVDMPDENKIWKKLSKNEFSTKPYISLKSKVDVIKYFPIDFNQQIGPILVCLPISQNLDLLSCPYKVLKDRGVENAMRHLEYNMSEEDIESFCVGNTYRLPSIHNMQVYLYCTQDWDIGVAKSISDSFSSCLMAGETSKQEQLYIFPPGIYYNASYPNHVYQQYPVEFTVQKCLRALAKRDALLKKFVSVHLVVHEEKFYKSFQNILKCKTNLKESHKHNFLSSNKKMITSESYVDIYEKKEFHLFHETKAFQQLKQQLETKMEENSITIQTQMTKEKEKEFISLLKESPSLHVNVTFNRTNVTVGALTSSAIDDFCEQHRQFLPRNPSYGGKISMPKSSGATSKSTVMANPTVNTNQKVPLTVITSKSHQLYKALHNLLGNSQLFSIEKIESEYLLQRFTDAKPKKADKKCKEHQFVWIRVKESSLGSLTENGFNAWHSYGYNYNHKEIFFQTKLDDQWLHIYPEFNEKICLLVCNVLCDEHYNFFPRNGDFKTIRVDCNNFDSEHVLPTFICSIKPWSERRKSSRW